MSVRFNRMWSCIVVWLLVDLAMMKLGAAVPTYLAFDGWDAFKRDLWLVVFVGWMWISAAERPDSSGKPGK